MASACTDSRSCHEVRSLSLPSKLNHINHRIEQEIKRLKTKEESSTSSSESISIGVSGLVELYKCIIQALSLPMTQQALSLRQHEKHVGELLKGCSSLLDICNSIKEVVAKQGAITRELQSSVSETANESAKIIAMYNSSRKEVIREAKDLFMSLNQVIGQVLGNEDNSIATVIKSLRCVSIINLSVFESILSFLSMPVSKPKRSLVSKLMNKGWSKCESGNEINNVDNVLHELVSMKKINEEKLCFSQEKIRELVGVIKVVEDGLENMNKELSETKVYLMKILSF